MESLLSDNMETGCRLACIDTAMIKNALGKVRTNTKRKFYEDEEEDDLFRLFPEDKYCPFSPMKKLRLSPIPKFGQPLCHGKSYNTATESCTSTHSNDPALFMGKGQLKLAVYINYGLLTIHIIQARHLTSKWKTFADSYVKLSLVPDDSKRTRCKTDIYPDTNQPVFDQKYSFELLEADSKKRLLVSIWHKDYDKGRSEFLGCMSFGVRSLLAGKKAVNGWYYLLTEDVGKRKHLLVSDKSECEEKGQNIPRVNKDILWMDPFTITVRRGKTGYGFTVLGCSPVKVGKVDEGSAAKDAGLCEGDYIVRINGQNVSRSTAESVVRIVKHSQKHIVLDIQRTRRLQSLDGSMRKVLGGVQVNGSTQHLLGDYCYDDERSVESEPSSQGVTMSTQVMPQLTLTYQDLTTSEQQKQTVVQKLVQCEQHFLDIVQAGIQSYLQPLKSSILTQHQHLLIFQNLEKLLRMSEHHLAQLQEYSVPYSDNDRRHEVFIDTIGGVYEPKVDELCEEYESYCRGIKLAEQQLLQLKSNKQFSRFVQETSQHDQLDLGTVLYKPMEHIQELCTLLQGVLVNTPHHHHDYEDLTETVEDVQDLCGRMIRCNTSCNTASLPRSISLSRTESLISRSSSQARSNHYSNSTSMLPRTSTRLSLLPRLTSQKSATLQRSRSKNMSLPRTSSKNLSLPRSSSKSSNSSSSSSVDSEVLSIQSRLKFAKAVPEIQLACPSRHLIYSGEMLQQEKKRWTKHVGLLFTDMMMIAKPEGDKLHITDDPIVLNDIKSMDFNLQHPLEFAIQVIAEPVIWTGHDHTIVTQTYRAPTTEAKLTWKTILEQHLAAMDQSRNGDGSSHEGTLAIL